MFVIFLLMYRFVGKKREKRIRHCIIGSIFTTASWYIISFFFSIYVNIFTGFSIIYGSLATITLIMMWLYTIIYAIFLGAEFNVITEDKIDSIFAKLKNKKNKVRLLKENN